MTCIGIPGLPIERQPSGIQQLLRTALARMYALAKRNADFIDGIDITLPADEYQRVCGELGMGESQGAGLTLYAVRLTVHRQREDL